MIRAVLDTNVLLAALLSKNGASFEIVRRLRRGEWRMIVSNHLALEYEEVLKRHSAKLKLAFSEVDILLNAICYFADFISLPRSPLPRLIDPDDEPLLLAAEVSGARLIVTHNFRHLREAIAYDVSVLRPREFLRMVRSSL